MRRAAQTVNHVQSALTLLMIKEGMSEVRLSFNDFIHLGLDKIAIHMFISDEEVEPNIPAYVTFKLVRKNLQ